MASEGLESKAIVIVQSTITINNQNIGMLITAKINKVNKRSEKVGNTFNRYTIVWGRHR